MLKCYFEGKTRKASVEKCLCSMLLRNQADHMRQAYNMAKTQTFLVQVCIQPIAGAQCGELNPKYLIVKK